MDDARITQIVEAVVRQLVASGAVSAPQQALPPSAAAPAQSQLPTVPPLQVQLAPVTPPSVSQGLMIDLPDPTTPEWRYKARVKNPRDPQALKELIASTTARIGVGRAGPRYTTASLLLFQGDHAVTQDALYRDIDQKLLDEFGLFTVQTCITGGKEQYLLRPDLGRQLSDDAKRTINEKCVKSPNIQLVVGEGLSAAAIEANLRQIFPVIKQGAQAAGLSLGTPFHVKYARVGVMNDIGEAIKPDVVILLIGERPGLGRAESMSAYMGYKPKYGDTDAERDVVCNIFENGGTNPLEAGAYVIQIAREDAPESGFGCEIEAGSQLAAVNLCGRMNPAIMCNFDRLEEMLMGVLDPIYATPLSVRLIPNVDPNFAEQLKLRPEQHSIGLITADNDDATYVSIDEATKMADVEVVYAHSFYAGAKHSSGLISGEIMAILAGPNPAEVRAGLNAALNYMKNEAIWYSANEDASIAFFPHLISRTGSYLSKVCNIPLGAPIAYLIAPPMEGLVALDAALKAAAVSIASLTMPPSETNYMGVMLTGDQPACKAATIAFREMVLEIARDPIKY